MLIGVSEGFKRELETVGVGYRFAVSGQKVTVSAGYSHPIVVEAPADIKITSPSNTELVVEGIDKQKVSEFAVNIRKIRKPNLIRVKEFVSKANMLDVKKERKLQ